MHGFEYVREGKDVYIEIITSPVRARWSVQSTGLCLSYYVDKQSSVAEIGKAMPRVCLEAAHWHRKQQSTSEV